MHLTRVIKKKLCNVYDVCRAKTCRTTKLPNIDNSRCVIQRTINGFAVCVNIIGKLRLSTNLNFVENKFLQIRKCITNMLLFLSTILITLYQHVYVKHLKSSSFLRFHCDESMFYFERGF